LLRALRDFARYLGVLPVEGEIVGNKLSLLRCDADRINGVEYLY
jgi:hypothetical protein